MINIKFYRDLEGYFKAGLDDKYRLLGQYFESEVQGIAEVCQDLLDAIKELELGDRTSLEGVGNALGLNLTSERAIIWTEFTESEQTLELPLTDFKQALVDCLAFLQSF